MLIDYDWYDIIFIKNLNSLLASYNSDHNNKIKLWIKNKRDKRNNIENPEILLHKFWGRELESSWMMDHNTKVNDCK